MNRVVVARDGEEALDVLHGRTSPGEPLPAVVLLDLKLPKVSGLEVLRAMRSDAALCTIPVVILTSSAEGADVREAYKLGANSYICKPVDFENFAEAVGQLGLCWVLLNEAPPAPKGMPAHSSRY
jgi:two-component system response regulator